MRKLPQIKGAFLNRFVEFLYTLKTREPLSAVTQGTNKEWADHTLQLRKAPYPSWFVMCPWMLIMRESNAQQCNIVRNLYRPRRHGQPWTSRLMLKAFIQRW